MKPTDLRIALREKRPVFGTMVGMCRTPDVMCLIANAGMDPADLPEAGKDKMDFAAATATSAKAWKDIWGAGQGVGNIDDVRPARDIVLRMESEYRAALARVGAA